MQRPPPPTAASRPPRPPVSPVIPVSREAEVAELLRRKQHGVPLSTALFRSRMVWTYASFIIVPTAIAFMFVGGKTELSKEDLMKTPTWERELAARTPADRSERQQKINEVLFNTKGSFRHEWARKRDQARANE
jgi:hypothetical protein